MKKLMFAISLAGLLGLGASAAVQSANTFGVLKVTSSKKQTIIAVPWVKVGDGSSIQVSDLVMTSNLTPGDMLYYYDPSLNNGNGEYKAWSLDENKIWQAVNNVTANGITSGTGAALQTAPRGSALILVRQDKAPPIYLYGQYATGSSTSVVSPGTSAADPTWNLIAPSAPNDVAITSDNMTGTPNPGDFIQLNAYPTRKYYWDSNKGWGYTPAAYGSTRVDGLTVPAGTGAWYVSVGAYEAGKVPTFTW